MNPHHGQNSAQPKANRNADGLSRPHRTSALSNNLLAEQSTPKQRLPRRLAQRRTGAEHDILLGASPPQRSASKQHSLALLQRTSASRAAATYGSQIYDFWPAASDLVRAGYGSACRGTSTYDADADATATMAADSASTARWCGAGHSRPQPAVRRIPPRGVRRERRLLSNLASCSASVPVECPTHGHVTGLAGLRLALVDGCRRIVSVRRSATVAASTSDPRPGLRCCAGCRCRRWPWRIGPHERKRRRQPRQLWSRRVIRRPRPPPRHPLDRVDAARDDRHGPAGRARLLLLRLRRAEYQCCHTFGKVSSALVDAAMLVGVDWSGPA